MKKLAKFLLYSFITIAVVALGFVVYIQISGIPTYTQTQVNLKIAYTPEKAAEGQRLASMLCSKCHLNEQGDAYTGKKMTDVPTAFGEAHSANITQDEEFGIGKWSDGELAAFIRTGVKPNGN